MIILYSTDLHGNSLAYLKIKGYAIDHGITLIHLGADLLPKGSDILGMQKKFVNGFLKEYYQSCRDAGIDIIAMFGNDDLYTRKAYFKKYANLLDETEYMRDGYLFKGYAYVPDYPFGLKGACKLDRANWTCPDPYISYPVDVGPNGFYKIPDIKEYFAKKGTLEEDLSKISVDDHTIMAIHSPPSGVNLDVCADGRRVGSNAVYNFISSKQPPLVLSGHIHESYRYGGAWQAVIGKTLVIQPGQEDPKSGKTNIVIIDTSDGIKTEFLQI